MNYKEWFLGNRACGIPSSGWGGQPFSKSGKKETWIDTEIVKFVSKKRDRILK